MKQKDFEKAAALMAAKKRLAGTEKLEALRVRLLGREGQAATSAIVNPETKEEITPALPEVREIVPADQVLIEVKGVRALFDLDIYPELRGLLEVFLEGEIEAAAAKENAIDDEIDAI